MAQEQGVGNANISSLERQLQQKLYEFNWQTKALEESKQELLQVRQELLNKDIILEDRKRTIDDLKMQLATAHQIIELMQQEKSKITNERIQLQVKCSTALKERESLLEQTHATMLENMSLKLNVQKLMETVASNESLKKTMEATIKEMQNQFSLVNTSLKSNVTKLETEHQFLMKSVESVVQVNKRLQAVGLCAHAVYTKKNEQIQMLQNNSIFNKQINQSPSKTKFKETFYNHSTTINAKAVQKVYNEKDVKADKVEAIYTELEHA